eukprot:342083-Chlamydomonas_euryale.AAC.2
MQQPALGTTSAGDHLLIEQQSKFAMHGALPGMLSSNARHSGIPSTMSCWAYSTAKHSGPSIWHRPACLTTGHARLTMWHRQACL